MSSSLTARCLASFGLMFVSLATLPALAAKTAVPMRWQSETTEGYEIANAVAVGYGKVATVGDHYSRGCVPGACGIDAALRVYDAANGAVLWTSNYDFAHSLDRNNAVAIAEHAIITAGYSVNDTSTGGHDWWVVSAYAPDSGTLLWRDVLGDFSNDGYPWQIVIDGGRVYVTGTGGGACATGADSLNCDQITRIYDLATGQVLSTIRSDFAGGDDETLSLAVSGGRLIVGGSVGAGPSDTHTFPDVRAYDAATGKLLWDDVIRDRTGDGSVFKVAARGNEVVATVISDDDWLIRAYDAASGTILWSNKFSELPGVSLATIYDGPVQLAMDDDTVLVGGYGSTLPTALETYTKSSRDWVVRAYDARSGTLLWSDVHGSLIDTDEANGGVILANGQAFALGFVANLDRSRHTELRAYEARSGKLLWEDKVDRTGFPFGVTITLAADQGLLAAASYVLGTRPAGTPQPEASGHDLLVRSYSISAP